MKGITRLQHCSVPMPQGQNDEARRFYGGLLGLQEVEPPATLDRTRLVWFKLGDNGDELHVFAQDGFEPNAPGQHFCVQVADLEAVREDLEANGVEIGSQPVIHNRPRFIIHDPFRNRIEITQILGPYNEADNDLQGQ
jgi:catechol 2,3-dioxygenase-like lactoylglutathione lyase family enzyme